MFEYESRGIIPTSQILETCTQVVSSSGDVTFISDRFADNLFGEDLTQPFQMKLSSQGLSLVERYPKLLTLLDEEQRKKVIKRTIGRDEKKITLGVKQTYEESPLYDNLQPDGLQLFQAFSALEAEGVKCNTPIMATRWKFIYKWIFRGEINTAPYEKRYEYLRTLYNIATKLRLNDKWDPLWDIDPNPENYVVLDPASPNVLNWFGTLDTVVGFENQEERLMNSLHFLRPNNSPLI